jgi:hypothetical protein
MTGRIGGKRSPVSSIEERGERFRNPTLQQMNRAECWRIDQQVLVMIALISA